MRVSRRRFIKGCAASLLAFHQIKRQAFAQAVGESGLKDLYKDDFLVGTMIPAESFMREDKTFTALLTREFNSIATDNIFKWDHIHPTEIHWNWAYADSFIEFGEAHNVHTLGHTLLWHAQLPMGLFVDRPDKPINRDSLLKKIETHITTIVDRYKGRMNAWDVVNEAVDEGKGWVQSPWFRTIGPDYMEYAFNYAREADPKATLIYNDFNMWLPEKRDFVVNLLKEYKKKNVPIDVIGMQGHFGLTYPDLSELEKSIEAYAAQGMRIHFTELEVDVLPPVPPGEYPDYVPELDPYKDSLPDKVGDQLSRRYEEIFKMFLRHRDKIDRVTFWGTSDDESWKNDFPINGRTNYPLLFDRRRQPKKAYEAVVTLKAK